MTLCVSWTMPAPKNRTLRLTARDRSSYDSRLLTLTGPVAWPTIQGRTICQDIVAILDWLPGGSIDLLFLDSPYNLTKRFREQTFRQRSLDEYAQWFQSWFVRMLRLLKPTASIYVCADWRSSSVVHRILEEHVTVRNRITWERDKGRGALRNWKNCAEDIWFATRSNTYTFQPEAVKLKRKVIAPYTDVNGRPKDWRESAAGKHRLTFPSNLWTDVTVPFWSMPENTDHPAQKPEKLLAKIILASSKPGDVVFDPFFGSGTALVVAKKLGRHFAGVERDRGYCLLAEKRLAMAEKDPSIQGFRDGVFWERNSGPP